MFPDARQAWRRLKSHLDRIGGLWEMRLGVAAVLVIFHLGAFAHAGRDLLDLPFNAAPGHAPYYSDPDVSSVRTFPRQPHYWSRLVVSRWDAQHHIGFAVRGLTSCPTDGATATDEQYLDCGLAWSPAWGEVGGLVSTILPIAPDVALVVLAVLAALAINVMWTSKTIVSRIGRFEAYAALIAFNLFPTGFFVVTPYTEGATFALAFGGFLCLANQRWIASALLIGAATALSATAVGFGVALGCAAVAVALRCKREGAARWWRPLVAIPLAVWGWVVQAVVLQIVVGDATAPTRARDAFYGAHAGLHWGNLLDPAWYITGLGSQHMDSVVVIVTIAIFALAGRETLRKFERPEAIFLVAAAVTMLVLPILETVNYWGLNRAFLLCPLTFLCLGVLARKYRIVFAPWLVLSFGMYWHVEMCSYVAQGDPRLCDCLGRVEAYMPVKIP